jgi:hypothetical protein
MRRAALREHALKETAVEPRIFVCTVHIASEPFWSSVQPAFVRRHLPAATLVAAVDDELAGDLDFDHLARREWP